MDVKNSFPDNPNPLASIGIICPYPFFIDIFASVYEALAPHAEFVCEPLTISGQEMPTKEKWRFKEMLTRSGMHWRDFESSDESAPAFFNKYHTLVGALYEGTMRAPYNRTKRKVRVFYGAAKDLWMYALWNAHYDLICAPGAVSAERLQSLYPATKIVVTGEPKFDGTVTLNQQQAREVLKLSSQKKVVLVLSTWGNLSTFDSLYTHLVRLSENYTVLLKPHHLVAMFEPEVLKRFEGTDVQVIDYLVSVATAILAADVVVSDNSGAIFDSIILERALVLTDAIGPYNEVFYTERPFYGRSESNKLQGAPATRESDEQKIKRPESALAPVVPLYKRLLFEEMHRHFIDSIESAGRADYRERQKIFCEKHFMLRDGNAGKRIAAATQDLISQTASQTRVENFQSALVRDFEERIWKNFEELTKREELQRADILSDFRKLKSASLFEKIKILRRYL